MPEPQAQAEAAKEGGELQTTAPRVLFGALTGLTGWLVYSCLVPPNISSAPVTEKGAPEIRDTAFLRNPALIAVSRTLFLAVAIYQALHIAFSPSMRPGAPQKGTAALIPLNKTLLTFNRISVPVLLLACAGAAFRLYVFSELGSNFTFNLQQPSTLKTNGLYEWAQHPSYVGGAIATILGGLWFCRLDGVLGLIVPDWLRMYEQTVHRVAAVIIPVGILVPLGIRVMEEEAMLRGQFGGEWEAWHQRTARFIPGIF